MLRTFLGICLSAAALHAPTLLAQQTYTWTGATSKDWNTASNWNPNGVPGTNSEDVADFNTAACTGVTISQTVALGAISFGYGPVCSFQVNADFDLKHGILNLSTTTSNTFTIGAGVTAWFAQDGDAANSTIVNNGALEFSGTSSAGTAQITNNAGSTIVLTQSANAANAVIYNAGIIDDSYLTATSSVGGIAGSGASTIYLGSQTLQIGNLDYEDSIDGPIADGGFNGGSGGALTKVGSGFLQLTGNNTYTGKTTVEQGLLEVDGSLAGGDVVVQTGAVLAGTGSLAGNIAAQAGSSILTYHFYDAPDTASPNTSLSASRLFCAPSPTVYERIGNVGGSTHGDYLKLNASLQQSFCPHLHFSFASAGLPLTVGDYYLLVLIDGTTDYGAGNIDFDFNYFSAYHQATGNIVIVSLSSVSAIYLQLTDLGNEIFGNGFE